jgi:signal transduction histidine kinase
MQTEMLTLVADILIVDDKPENIRLLSDFLSKQGYRVRKAISGQAALATAATLAPDLILLDINMPGVGGYEVCRKLKSDPQTNHVPVIFLSAGHEVVDKVQAFQVGGIDYITKPFQLEEVLVRVQTQLKIKSLQTNLQVRNKELQQMVAALGEAQAELLHKDKMASIGRIVAGISHEINNPLSFVLCNLTPALEYSQKLVQLIDLYQAELPHPSTEVQSFIHEADIDFITSDFPRVIESMRTGSERIRSVVEALHTFSHLNESGIKPIDASESIQSVLAILRSRLASKNEVSKISVFEQYEPMPQFPGYASLFNQVLLHLLENAIDALERRLSMGVNPDFEPSIWIQAKVIDNQAISISIRDNGMGILVEHQRHIFEPFFTTKEIGQGSGLNLFTSHQIICGLHKGALTYNAQLEGIEFTIKVPINGVAN